MSELMDRGAILELLRDIKESMREANLKVDRLLDRVGALEVASAGRSKDIDYIKGRQSEVLTRLDRLEEVAPDHNELRDVENSISELCEGCPAEGCARFHDFVRNHIAEEAVRISSEKAVDEVKSKVKTGNTDQMWKIIQAIGPYVVLLLAWFFSNYHLHINSDDGTSNKPVSPIKSVQSVEQSSPPPMPDAVYTDN